MPSATLTTTPPQYLGDPYITPAEYRQAPTGVDPDQLVKGNPAANEAELYNVMRRATGAVAAYCGQSLNATVDTESARLFLNRDGEFVIHPRYHPILEVTAFAYGGSPTSLTAMTDFTSIWIEPHQFVVTAPSGYAVTAGPVQFGTPRVGGKAFCSWTYVNGYPHTTLATGALASATSITVTSATGILPGLTMLTIYDGAQTETVCASATYTLGSTTVLLNTPLLYAHAVVGTQVSALPPAAKQATILYASTLIQTRGTVAMIAPAMGGVTSRYTQTGSAKVRTNHLTIDDNLAMAQDLLLPFRRVR